MECLKSVTIFVMIASTLQFADAQVLGFQNVINISGNISCSVTGIPIANATIPTSPFPNALVEVVCGGNVISSTITNGSGIFNTTLNTPQFPLTNLFSPICNVRVATSLSNCDTTLPSTGFLQSPLQLTSTFVRGLFNIVNLAPAGFQLTGN